MERHSLPEDARQPTRGLYPTLALPRKKIEHVTTIVTLFPCMNTSLINAPALKQRPRRPSFPSTPPSSGDKTEITIAYIGGGSRQWAMHLMKDLALSDQLTGTLRLYDIDHDASLHNVQLSEEVFSHPDAKTSFHVVAESELSTALKGADFVVISIEPGPTELRYADLEIPASYGVLQTVGDTTGPGGIMRALRTVPVYREFARAIMEYCPNAWVINYTNPMAVCTATLTREAPGIKVFGCCHEVFGTQKILAKYVESWFETETPPREEIILDIAGVNHFTWATGASWRGYDLMPLLKEMVADPGFFRNRTADSLEAVKTEAWFDHQALVANDLFRRFGALGAAGDRHLAEFVPWYLTSEEELHRWGVLMTPYSWRLQRIKAPRKAQGSLAGKPLEPSGEEGVQQMEALLGLRALTTNVNMPNLGQMSGTPSQVVVETYAEFGRDRVRPLLAPALPAGAANLVRQAVSEQELTVEAGFTQSADLAFQAMLNHPLVTISTDRAHEMFTAMMDATKPF